MRLVTAMIAIAALALAVIAAALPSPTPRVDCDCDAAIRQVLDAERRCDDLGDELVAGLRDLEAGALERDLDALCLAELAIRKTGQVPTGYRWGGRWNGRICTSERL